MSLSLASVPNSVAGTGTMETTSILGLAFLHLDALVFLRQQHHPMAI